MPRRSKSQSLKDGQQSDKPYPTQIIIKFDDQISIPSEVGAEGALEGEMREMWVSASKQYPGITLQPFYNNEDVMNIRNLVARARENDPNYLAPNFLNYFIIQMPAGFEGAPLSKMLVTMPGVETTYVDAGPVDPPVNPMDDPRYPSQGYLQAAPQGIDAIYAWTHPGGNGAGVLFVDLERGWALDHEDLLAARITLISGINKDFVGHGTAVLGEVVAVDNTLGGVGIAPQAWARVVSQWRTNTTMNTAAAIMSAVTVMPRGSVLLLEVQTDANSWRQMPVEAEQATFDAIQLAVATGIVVIEAAGNGGNDLDAYTDQAGHPILNRMQFGFRDSGAIIVGAASSGVPHRRWSRSNFGNRVDCYSWGENIDTAGGGSDFGNTTTVYTSWFGETSGAAAIIAGAAILVQSLSLHYRRQPYGPSEIRAMLSDLRYGTPSANPPVDRIGVMPNLREIIDGVLNIPPLFYPLNIYRAVLQILFGVTNDAPGVVIGPDGKPIPVGPWDPTAIQLSQEKVDLLMGLAITESARVINDDFTRKEVQRAGLLVMQKAFTDIEKNLKI